MTINSKMVLFIDVQVGAIPFDKDKEYIGQYVALTPVSMNNFTVLTRYPCGGLSFINEFMAEAVHEQLTFSKEQGWTKN